MEIREFTEEDYPMLAKWWAAWEWDAIPSASLPQTGLIVSNGGVDIYAGFLYRTDSNICLFEAFISNKDAPRDLRNGGLDHLLEQGKILAKNMGFGAVMCFVKNPSLMAALTRQNILPTDKDTTTFVGVL